MREPLVHVVPIIDTEGPTTGRSDLYDTWESLGDAVRHLTQIMRGQMQDSFGSPAIYNWFVIDWTGYSSDDPEFRRRGHDNRLHAVWNFYRDIALSDRDLTASGDGLFWHYHHPPKNGAWGWNADWNDSSWHEYIIGKRMLDFGHFPAMYRAGKYVENNLNSHWLERWIPFDFSSIAPVKRDFCDWSEAPANWQPYHPSMDNYQHPGTMRRLVARSLPVAAKGGSGMLSEEEVEKAFREAKEVGRAVFSFHSHDYYKSMHSDFETAYAMITRVARAYGVSWKFSNALSALREYVLPVFGAFSLQMEQTGNQVQISASHAIFGDMPFVALEYAGGNVVRIDADRKEKEKWIFSVPEGVRRYGVGTADSRGNTDVKILTIHD